MKNKSQDAELTFLRIWVIISKRAFCCHYDRSRHHFFMFMNYDAWQNSKETLHSADVEIFCGSLVASCFSSDVLNWVLTVSCLLQFFSVALTVHMRLFIENSRSFAENVVADCWRVTGLWAERDLSVPESNWVKRKQKKNPFGKSFFFLLIRSCIWRMSNRCENPPILDQYINIMSKKNVNPNYIECK